MTINVKFVAPKIKVTPLKKNSVLIETDQGTFLQSYRSIIAYKPNGGKYKVVLDERFWEYSATTGRHRNLFLNETIIETRQKIESGEYLLANMN